MKTETSARLDHCPVWDVERFYLEHCDLDTLCGWMGCEACGHPWWEDVEAGPEPAWAGIPDDPDEWVIPF